MLVVAGQFDASKALAMVADTLGAIPKPTRVLEDPVHRRAHAGRRTVRRAAPRRIEPDGDGGVARPGARPSGFGRARSADRHHGQAAADGGGGGAGTGRLYKALVDSKKALNVRMSFQEMHDPGFVIASATLNHEQSLDDVRKTMLDTIAAVATDPPTADEIARAKTRILQGMETRMANSQQAALGLSETIASGDWRLLLRQLRSDQERDARRSRPRREALFQGVQPHGRRVHSDGRPGPHDVPASSELASLLKDYKTGLSVSAGEAFDSTPAAVEKRLVRAALPNGMKLVLLPKTVRGGTVSATIQLRFGDAQSLMGLAATADLAGALLSRARKPRRANSCRTRC